MLGFEGDSVAGAVGRQVELAGGVDLHGGLGGLDREGAAGGGVAQEGGGADDALGLVEHEAVVEPGAVGAESLLAGEVEPGAGDGGDGAGRDVRRIGREVARGGDGDFVVERRAAAGEIEIGVVGQVDHRGAAGDAGGIVEAERVVRRQRVGDVDGEVAGEAVLAVRAEQAEGEGAAGGGDDVPHAVAEIGRGAVGRAAMQGVGALVGRQGVANTVEREGGAGDTVGVAADERAEIGAFRLVVGEGGAAQHDIGEAAAPVGDQEFLDDAAIVEQAD